MKKKYIGLLVAAVAVLSMLSACSAPKDITYMQGFDNGMAQEVRSQSRITAQPDDRLGIYVSSSNPELAQVFNLAIPQQRIGQATTMATSNQASAAFTLSLIHI